MIEAATTIAGPVGILEMDELAIVPVADETAPKRADKRTIGSSRLVHWRAATEGAISMALMRMIPTAWIDSKTVIIVRKERRTFNFPPGSPSAPA